MEWTDKLATGISTIDSQHKELFKRINNLAIAIKQRRCKAEIEGTIKFLDDYARIHFSEEENICAIRIMGGWRNSGRTTKNILPCLPSSRSRRR